MPQCVPIRCGDVPALQNTVVISVNETFSGLAVFACVPGYELAFPSPRLVCSADGYWTNFSANPCKSKLNFPLSCNIH